MELNEEMNQNQVEKKQMERDLEQIEEKNDATQGELDNLRDEKQELERKILELSTKYEALEMQLKTEQNEN